MLKCKRCNKLKSEDSFKTPNSMCDDCKKRARKLTLLKCAEASRERSKAWYDKHKLLVSHESRLKYKNDPEFRAKKRAANKNWDENNKEYKALMDKKYREENKERLSEQKKAYREEKKKDQAYLENKRIKGLEYYYNNKETCNERAKKWLERNKDRAYQKSLEWKRANIEKVREVRNKSVLKWMEANPEKKKAQSKLQTQVALGKIIKPKNCSICGKEKQSRDMIGHHHDYSKPLDVIFCCRKCHSEIHSKLRNNTI